MESFTRRDGKTIVEGVFSMSRFAKAAFAASGVLLTVLEALFVVSAFRTDAPMLQRIIFALFLPVVVILIVGVHLFLKRLFRKDVDWISAVVVEALKS
jgi:hypothetical protein